MIRGHFVTMRGRLIPFVDAVFHFPALNQSLEVPLLVDTGADRTILSPFDTTRLVRRFSVDLATLPRGTPGTGVGGQVETRTIEAVLTLDTFSIPLLLTVVDPLPGPTPPIPSLLGRDILSHFALFMEERTRRVLLLEPHEADALPL